jgi:hypothetical protein
MQGVALSGKIPRFDNSGRESRPMKNQVEV